MLWADGARQDGNLPTAGHVTIVIRSSLARRSAADADADSTAAWSWLAVYATM